MARGSYLGKISAIVSINTASVRPSLNTAAKDVDQWAKKADSSIRGAAQSYERALKGIFTPLQRLQAAIKTANSNPLSFQIQNAQAFTQLAKATEQIAKPLGQVQAQFAGLASSVQTELLPVLQSAQKQTTSLFNAISSGAKVSDKDIDNTTARVERLNQVIKRAGEASTLSRGLATGQELRFQSPEFISQARRASELQQQAAALSPSQLSSRDFAGLVSQQRQAAIEAERLLAALDRIRTTRNGDSAAAQKQYNEQIAALGQINNRLSEQIALAKASVVENQGEATNVKDRLAASARLLKAQQDEASFRAKAADEAEREAQATARVVEQLNRAFAVERDRRSGAAPRRNAAAFNDSTAGVLGQQQQRTADLFAREQRTIRTELARTAQLRSEFFSLPAEAQSALEAERAAINRVANAASAGAASIGVLEDANNRMASAIAAANARLEQQAGAAVDVSARLAAIQAVQVAQQNEASFRSRAADEAEREAQATARVVEQLNRAFAVERSRRSGAASRRNASAFDDSTAGVLGQQQQTGGTFFGTPSATLDSELQRTRDLYQEFLQLSPEVQAALEQQGRRLNNVADAASRNAASLGLLVENNDRMAESMRAAGEVEQPPPPPTPIPPGFFQDRLAQQVRRELGPALDNPQRQLDGLRGSITSVKSQLDSLPLSVRTHFLPAINAAENEFLRLNALGPSATLEDIEAVVARMQTLEGAANRASRAFNFRSSLSGGSAENLNLNIQERSLAGYQSQLQLLQQTLGRVSTQARGPAVASFIALENAIATAFQNGTLDSASTRRQLAALTQEAVRASAAVAGIRVGALTRQLARVGDVARGSFGNVGLGVQQAVFAIDDFFSVTGDLSQRIRAAGNNISQLGFIIGGTAGLITGVAVSLGGQAVAALIKWIYRTDEASSAAKELNAALGSQKNKVNELADAYRQLARETAKAGISREAQARLDRQTGREERERLAVEAAKETIASNDPRIAIARGRAAAAQKQIEEATTPVAAFDAANALRRAQRDRDRIEQEAANSAISTANRAGAGGRNPVAVLQQDVRQTKQQLRDIEAIRRRGFDVSEREAQIRQRLADREAALIIARSRESERLAGASIDSAGSRERTASNLEAARGFTAIQALADEVSQRFQNVQQQLQDGAITADTARRDSVELNKLGVAIERASIAVGDFASALERQAGELARTVAGDATQVADKARREANAVAARFGEDDPRTRRARADARRADQDRAAAAERSLTIDEEISKSRQKFENDLLRGRGNPADVRRAERIRQDESAIASGRLNPTDLEAARLRVQRNRLDQAAAFDQSPAARELRRRADQSDIFQQQSESALRGRDLAMSPAERAGRELADRIADITEYFTQAELEAADVPEEVAKIRARMNEAVQRTQEDTFRSVAPLLATLQDNVQNAILQGPSRAALNASDVATMEGSRELNRLLRGDDPARDQDLAALQRQANEYLRVIADKQEPQVAN